MVRDGPLSGELRCGRGKVGAGMDMTRVYELPGEENAGADSGDGGVVTSGGLGNTTGESGVGGGARNVVSAMATEYVGGGAVSRLRMELEDVARAERALRCVCGCTVGSLRKSRCGAGFAGCAEALRRTGGETGWLEELNDWGPDIRLAESLPPPPLAVEYLPDLFDCALPIVIRL